MRLRSLLSFGLRAALVAVIVAQALYLLRRPLVEPWLCQTLGRVVSDELGMQVQIGGLGGDWLTTVVARDVQVHGEGDTLRVEDAQIHVEFDLWRLAHGDLAGVRRARVRIGAAAVDLRARGAPSEGAAPPPPDLAHLASLLPGGADIEVATCTVRGAADELAGRVHVHLLPARPGRPRRCLVDAPGVQVTADVLPSGAVEVHARMPDAGRLARLVQQDVQLAGGRADVQATLALRPQVACTACVQFAEIAVEGQHIVRATTWAHLDARGVRDLDCDFALPDGAGRARGVSIPFADPRQLGGEVHVAVDDLAPVIARLPPDARAGMPSAGMAHARCAVAGGHVHVDLAVLVRGLLPDAAARVTLSAGTSDAGFDLEGFALTAPDLDVRARGTLRAIALRAVLDAPHAALAAPLSAEITMDAPDVQRLGLERFGVAARGRIAIAGTVAGTLRQPLPQLTIALENLAVGAPGDAPWCTGAGLRAALAPDGVRIESASAEVAGRRLTVSGNVSRHADLVTLTDVEIAQADGSLARVAGTLPWRDDGDWRAMLRAGADLRAEFVGVDLSTLLALPATAPRRLFGTLHWRTREGTDIGAMLFAATDPTTSPGQAATATLWLRADERVTRIECLQATFGPTAAAGVGRVDISPLALLDGTGHLAATTARGDLELHQLSLATLHAWSGHTLDVGSVSGRVRGYARLRGTLGAPAVDATLRLDEAALRTSAGQRLDDIACTIAISPHAVRLLDGKATRGKAPLTFTGALTAPAPLWQAWPKADLMFSLQGSNVLLLRQSGLKVRADLDLSARGPIDDIALTGRIALRDSRLVTRVPLIDLRRAGGEAVSTGLRLPELTLPAPLRVRLDVHVLTAEPLVAKTNVFEGNLHTQLELLGDLSAPRLQGTISGPEATVILPGCRLRATALFLQFTAENPEVPTLTLAARGRRHGFDILVKAKGPYDHPDVEFTSNPALPPDELVVLVTTGARPEALRGTRGVGTVVGTYVAQEMADWLFGSESTEAKESFIDDVVVETGTEIRNGTESIVVEFRVYDRIYLQGERDVYEDINMGLVYRIRFR